ncbi:DNA-binding protein [Dyadobacter sp. CY327]|uniref:PPC domain-containing DNA-binding protein n=1 Tax=Dyadobacter sp. CY327 TaxID=2907301 RepID=UPI001F2C303B|nr:PPC domain-containing DNA-binding protein [Dyadobacter sp. CY327]MCE7072208.1 DNA-binding protein [Dyadobacter sp. CY327]
MQIITFLSLLLFFSVLKTNSHAQEIPRYVKVPAGFLMVLRQGDDVFAELEKLAEKEKVPSANLSGMGFVNVKFGFFNFDTKEYDPKEFKDVELASMSGSLAWKEGKPSLHCHGTVTGKDFTAHGGHMLGATVSTGSVEIIITVNDKRLERVTEQPLGANVLRLE